MFSSSRKCLDEQPTVPCSIINRTIHEKNTENNQKIFETTFLLGSIAAIKHQLLLEALFKRLHLSHSEVLRGSSALFMKNAQHSPIHKTNRGAASSEKRRSILLQQPAPYNDGTFQQITQPYERSSWLWMQTGFRARGGSFFMAGSR